MSLTPKNIAIVMGIALATIVVNEKFIRIQDRI